MAPKDFFKPLRTDAGTSHENGNGSEGTSTLPNRTSPGASSEILGTVRETQGAKLRVIVPVPPEAPDPCHTQIGRDASAMHRYRDASGALLCYVVRVDRPDGNKYFVPLTYGIGEEGKPAWLSRALPVPRPLYGLDRLAQRPDAPVLIVEGEKAADAATRLFPTYVAVTSFGGAKSAAKADWTPLAGRSIVVWPDNDAPGKAYARETAKLGLMAGARTASLVRLPDSLPGGWDLADERPADLPLHRLAELVATAAPFAPSIEDADPVAAMPPAFRLSADGVEYREEDEEGEARWVWICSRLEILAFTRNADGTDWGLLLRVIDQEGRIHLWPMPNELLGGDGLTVREQLLRLGLRFEPRRRARLLEYLAKANPPLRVRCATKIGWHGTAFVLPDGPIGPAAEPIFLQTPAPLDHAFSVSGNLEEWQQAVGRVCVGNSRLVLAVCAALAAPLLHPMGMAGGGFHFRGASSTGKTTALNVAASVCGDPRRYVRTWRSTANGLEGAALAHNDGLLVLDELGQIDGREAGQAVYMLANGEGKTRARKDASVRPPARWRTLIVSSGEQSLADKAAEAGQHVHAGQEARLIDVPADAECGRGLFETLHGYATADAFARALADAVAQCHGTPLRAFLEQIASDMDRARERLREGMTVWLDAHGPTMANGQVKRVAHRFGLLAAAGEEAARLGIVPWPQGEASKGVAVCFSAWLTARGGIGPAEDMEAVRRVRRFIEQLGQSRFARFADPDPGRTISNRAGYRRDQDDGFEYLILRSVFELEICAGLNPKAAARALKAAGFLVPDKPSSLTYPVKLPIEGTQTRVYRIKATILEDGGPAGEDAKS